MSSPETIVTDWQDVQQFVDEVIKPEKVSGTTVSAFEEIDRGQFVPHEDPPSKELIYGDRIITLGEYSSVSEPTFVAKMIDLLALEAHERILEIGTATGYQAALLSRIVPSVDTIELKPELARQARSNLNRLHINNVRVHEGDGGKGIEGARPFDAIIITAQIKEVPPDLFGQLAVGGRIVAPVGVKDRDATLVRLTKTYSNRITADIHGTCNFVPFLSNEKGGWAKEEWEEVKQVEELKRLDAWRKYLQEQWKDGDHTYEEIIQFAQNEIARITDTEGPVSEGQVLELISLVTPLTYSRSKSK